MAEENYANQAPAVPSQAGVHEQRTTKRSASRARGRSTRVPVTGEGVLNDARQRMRTFKEDTDDYVRKNPTKAVLAALGIGFVLGLMRR